MTSNITELCQNFGIGLLLMYLETVSIKETPYLIIFSRSFYRKEMEIIGESKFVSLKRVHQYENFQSLKFEKSQQYIPKIHNRTQIFGGQKAHSIAIHTQMVSLMLYCEIGLIQQACTTTLNYFIQRKKFVFYRFGYFVFEQPGALDYSDEGGLSGLIFF